MDTQSVKTSTNVPLDTQGIDAGKKIIGRERGIITDTLGLLLAVIVTAASVSDNVIGNALLDQATTTHPALAKTCLARDYETRPDNAAAMITIAMIDNLARRITSETTPTWRDPQTT